MRRVQRRLRLLTLLLFLLLALTGRRQCYWNRFLVSLGCHSDIQVFYSNCEFYNAPVCS